MTHSHHPGQNNYPPLGETTKLPPLLGAQSTPEAPDEPIDDSTPEPPPNASLVRKIVALWHKTLGASGADESGLKALIYPAILNNASDAAMILPIANTLLLSSDPQGGKLKVAVYLLVTLAPYAIIAPFLGPIMDKIKSGRRIALTASFIIRAILALVLVYFATWKHSSITYSAWVLYPCTLAMMLCSKTFLILKAAITPRVVPPSLDLVQVNSRLNTFSSVIGTTVLGGGVTAIWEFIVGRFLHQPGGFIWMTIVCLIAAWTCSKLPRKVELAADETPLHWTQSLSRKSAAPAATQERFSIGKNLGKNVITCLTGVSTLKIMIGFLYLFMIFYPRAASVGAHLSPYDKFIIAAAGAGATGIGGFIGNIIGTKISLGSAQKMVLIYTTVAAALASIGAGLLLMHCGLIVVVIVALGCSTCTNAAKVSLDSSIQDNIAHNSQASVFGLSESTIQIMWVLGATLGATLPPNMGISFSIVAGILVIGWAQTWARYYGKNAWDARRSHKEDNNALEG